MAVRDEFKITRQGKTFVLYAGLLAEAHDRFIGFHMQTELIESGERPVVKAKFDGDLEGGGVIRTSGIGTAGRPTDRKGPAVDAPVEMAETRAKARALRDAVNVGITALEELSEGDEPGETQGQRRGGGSSGKSTPKNRKRPPANREENLPHEEMTDQEPSDEDPGRNSEPFASTQQIQALETHLDALKEEGEEKEEAIDRMIEFLGYPLELLAESKADELIATLQERRNKKALQEAKDG